MALLALAPAHVHANTTADSQIGGVSVSVGVSGGLTSVTGLNAEFTADPNETALTSGKPESFILFSVGYDYSCPDSFYAGAQVTGSKRLTKQKDFTIGTDLVIAGLDSKSLYEISGGVDARLKAGYTIGSRTIAYVFAGLSFDKIKQNASLSTTVMDEVNTTGDFQGALPISALTTGHTVAESEGEASSAELSEWRSSWMWGAGITTLVGSNVLVGLSAFMKKPLSKLNVTVQQSDDAPMEEYEEFSSTNAKFPIVDRDDVEYKVDSLSVGAEVSVGYQFSSCAA